MKTAYTSTALALLFGLGTAMATLPALAQQEGAVGTGDPAGAPAAVGEAGDESGATHPMEAHPARPEIVAQCDLTGDGFVSVDEARACYEEHFGTISGGMDHLTMDQFAAGMPEAADAEAMWEEIPRAEADVMTRDEWLAWREQGFAEVAPEGQMPAEDYAGWHLGATEAQQGTAAPQ